MLPFKIIFAIQAKNETRDPLNVYRMFSETAGETGRIGRVRSEQGSSAAPVSEM